MTSREKVLAAIEHRNSGRVPFTVAPCASLAVHGQKLLDLLCRYPNDFFDARELKIPKMEDLRKRQDFTDKWGCIWHAENVLFAGVISEHPLADWNSFASYKIPEVPKVTPEQIETAKKTGEQYPIWAGIEQFFQVMQNVRGTEDLFMDFYIQPEEIQKLIDRMLNEYHLPALEEQLKLKPDIVGFGDDWGTQTQLLINPILWRQFFKPVYKKLVDVCHQGGAKMFFHTCGYTMEIEEELISVGMDIVNPQTAIMDVSKYGDIARNRITVMPDLNQQGLLLNGTPAEVEKHIIEMYDKLGTPSGGLLGYCPIEPQYPLENVESILKTISSYEKR